MRRTDIEGIGELAGETLAAAGGLIEEMHEGIASRPFGILGPAAAFVRAVHDGVSRTIYGGVRKGLRAASLRGTAVLSRQVGQDGPALAATPVGSLVLGAINGLYGDHLRDRGNPLAIGMEIRRDGEEIIASSEGLAGGFPDATSRIAVFLHGLCENDESWRRLGPRNRQGSPDSV